MCNRTSASLRQLAVDPEKTLIGCRGFAYGIRGLPSRVLKLTNNEVDGGSVSKYVSCLALPLRLLCRLF